MAAGIHLDALIIGGGVAGMWTLDQLRQMGHSVWLVDAHALGAGQTIQSQGIIHGGLKYALGGKATAASNAIADMPARWRDALDTRLSAVAMRSDTCLLWSTGGLGRLGLAGARMGLRATPRVVEDPPAILKGAPRPILEVPEPVLEPASLLSVLATLNHEALLACNGPEALTLSSTPDGVEARIECNGESLVIHADRLVLAAGSGNELLRAQLGLDAHAMQIRPLRMVVARGDLPQLNGHVIKGTSPWLTITTTQDMQGRRVWQIGGDVAEQGATLTPSETIELARAHLRRALPGLDVDQLEMGTYAAPRAEGKTPKGARPGTPTVLEDGPVLTAWPTKLALAPLLADTLAKHLPSARREGHPVPEKLPRPAPAKGPWEMPDTWNTDD
ncbi:MAG: FAD-dependent oxidoreductase [Phycisphaerales bacterium]|nr:FAD-dependent oxidoreductase [Phycisphaerales bacterium]